MKRYLIFTSCLLFSSNLFAKEAVEVSFSTTEVRDGIYMIAGVNGFVGGNVALTVGEDGVVMIDDALPTMLDKLQLEVKKSTNRNIDYLINTHLHGDHIGNNHAFAEQGARIVAHDTLRQMLLDKGTFDGEKNVPVSAQSLPVISYSESMSLYLNGDELDLIHMPAAHTATDTVILFRQANVIHAGDIFFNGNYPFIDIDNGGSLSGYIAGQQAIADLADEDTAIIPGHGALANREDLLENNRVLKELSRLVKALVDDGKTAEQILDLDPLSKYHEQWGTGFIDGARMTQQLINALQQ